MLCIPIPFHAKRKPTWRLRVWWLAKLAWYDVTWKSSITKHVRNNKCAMNKILCIPIHSDWQLTEENTVPLHTNVWQQMAQYNRYFVLTNLQPKTSLALFTISTWTRWDYYFNYYIIISTIILLLWRWHVITSGILILLGMLTCSKELNTSYLSEMLL